MMAAEFIRAPFRVQVVTAASVQLLIERILGSSKSLAKGGSYAGLLRRRAAIFQ